MIEEIDDAKFISIHALREEGDRPWAQQRSIPPDFYPRPPRGGRPVAERVLVILRRISIHALREEGDRGLYHHAARLELFLSTPSARRATCCVVVTPILP